jgi:RNA:NAD 2'-phosphotransferase (TPT1/KptA family)
MADLNIDITNGQSQDVTIVLPEGQQVSTILQPTQSVSILDKYSIVGLGGSADKHYVHLQNIPSASWVVTHNLNKRPSVVVVDSAESVVVGEVEYNSDNQVTLTFAGSFSGKAYFN